MKTLKVLRRAIVSILALAMVFGLGMPALAADTGWIAPNSDNSNTVKNPEKAYAPGSGSAEFDSETDIAYYRFPIDIPSGSTIDGIEVEIGADISGDLQRDLIVALYNWDGVSNWISYGSSQVISDSALRADTDHVFTLGGASEKWGYNAWDTVKANGLRVAFSTTGGSSNNGNDKIQLDYVQLKVYYSEPTSVTLNYSANDTLMGSVSRASETIDPDGTALGSTATANPGYYFMKWTESGTQVSTDPVFVPAKAGDPPVYASADYLAIFAKDPSQWFTITYNANGGSGTEFRDPSDIGEYLEGRSVTLAGKGSMALANHTFGGWSETVDGTALTDPYTIPNHSVTLYAVWTPVQPTVYTVTYDSNAGTDTVTNMPIDNGGLPGSNYLIPILAPQRAGYTFMGWRMGEQTVQPGDSFTLTGNVTLYAQWSLTYTVTYDANAGNDAVTNMPIDNGGPAGSNYLIPNLTPLRTGYTFMGWRMGEQTLQPGNSFTLTGNVVLSAQWRENENETMYHNLTVNVVPPEGGSVTGVSTGQYAYLYPAIATAVPASEYRFVGWKLDQQTQSVTLTAAGDYTSTVNPYPFNIYGDAILTAYFEKLEDEPVPADTYTVSYHPNGGLGTIPVDTHQYYHGDKATLLSGTGLRKGNLTWIGWELRDGTDVTSPLTMPKHDVTLFAVYGPVNIPKTGDSAGCAGWLMILGALSLAAIVTVRKRACAK